MQRPAIKTTWRKEKPIRLRTLATALMGAPDAPLWVVPTWFAGALLVNKASDALRLPALLAVALALMALYLIRAWWTRRKTEIVPELTEAEPPGKRGMVLPLSTIALIGGTQEERAHLEKVLERLQDNSIQPNDDDFLALARTNLEAAFRAVEYHFNKNTLRDCWLITTKEVTDARGNMLERGSGPAAPILERWFYHVYPNAPNQLQFHYGPELQVGPRDYAMMWLLVDELFEKAPYKADQLIVDITPGTKPMSIALALACLEPGRTMQYLASGRHPVTGEILPGGQRRPVLIDIQPYLYREAPGS